MLGQYNATRAKIVSLAEFVKGDGYRAAMSAFIEGNAGDERLHRYLYVDKLFEVEPAIAALNAEYWQKALSLTDVLDMMPQARRGEWHESIRRMKTPDFTEDAVRPTILGLLNMRQTFLAEKVDGIFRGLSGEHVTNAPEAFGKRMIIKYVLDAYGHVNSSKSGLVHDLRGVIARFMGREQPSHAVTSRFLEECRRTPGQWITTDGGALRVRCYKNGNGHMEIHPDMAWRLNCVLAHLYPAAIPSEFRQKPKKKTKEFAQLLRPLPFPVLEILASVLERRRYAKDNTISLLYDRDNPIIEEVAKVLMSVGGARDPLRSSDIAFDYDPTSVLREIVVSGCLPDRQSFQFHQTSETLAADAVEWAEIGDTDTVLEPSAGQGAIAAHLPVDRLQCVELSSMHCEILRARGFKTEQADFIVWAQTAANRGRKFDVIAMNPPFADGRAQLHVEHAYSLLAPGGRLVAVVPASLKGKQFLPDVQVEFSKVYDHEFKTANVSVVLMRAVRPRAQRTPQGLDFGVAAVA